MEIKFEFVIQQSLNCEGNLEWGEDAKEKGGGGVYGHYAQESSKVRPQSV
jgi:hypothetical protein